jgi:hypothetical protein
VRPFGAWPRLLGEGVLVTALYLAAAAILTWPAVAHLDQVIIGGGELGGWLWRQWWHLNELQAIASSDAGLIERALAVLGLGRYPETGNIVDVMLLAWPLQALFGMVAGYNLQVLLILGINGLCGYALARSLVGDRPLALAAGLVAVVNPVCLQDIEASGLRQVLLWWLLLLPIPLRKAIEEQSAPAAAMAGVLLGLTAIFYWFYGLFAGILIAIWLAMRLWRHGRSPVSGLRELRWVGDLVLFTAVIAVPFLTPYALDEGSAAGTGRSSELPELTWFQDFPDSDTIALAPLRPESPEENLLSSLQRGLMSSWSPDWIVNPAHGRAMPVAVFWLGVLPLLVWRRNRDPTALAWLAVFVFFYLGTLGPFLKPLGGQGDTAEFILVGGEAVRLPWTWMFKWIPGMARMFGPYRMGSLVVVAGVALLALAMARLPENRWARGIVAAVVLAATMLQASWRWDTESLSQGTFAAERWRPALEVSALQVPGFYTELPAVAGAGIIELPLGQQQDLICFYQLHHGRKIYRGWATEGAVPPLLRSGSGGSIGEQLRYLAALDGYSKSVDDALAEFSRDPIGADLDGFDDEELDLVLAAGGYRHVVLHERGYFLVDPENGTGLYRLAVEKMAARLGVEATSHVDLAWFDFPGNRLHGNRPARANWTASRVALHDDALPSTFHMAVFDVAHRVDGFDGEIPRLGPTLQGPEGGAPGTQGPGQDIVLVVVPGLPADLGEPGLEAAFLAGLGRTPTTHFRQTHAQTTSPYLGLGSLLTGRYPSTLPLCSFQGGDPSMGRNAATTWCTRLPRSGTNLPQALSIHGYATGATVTQVGPAATRTDRWQSATRQVLEWWDQVDAKPRFALVVVPDLVLEAPEIGESQASRARALGVDVAALLDAIEEASPAGAPLVMLTSTTGLAAPAAPGWIRHSDLRVPLWLFEPGVQGATRTVDTVVELLDVLPTLVAWAHGTPAEELVGTDLLAEVTTRTPRLAYAEAGDGLAVRSGRWLLTFRGHLDDAVPLDPRVTDRLLNHTVADSEYFRLHDIVADPNQEVDLLAQESETAAEMREVLIGLRTGLGTPPGDMLTPDRLSALRALNGGQVW